MAIKLRKGSEVYVGGREVSRNEEETAYTEERRKPITLTRNGKSFTADTSMPKYSESKSYAQQKYEEAVKRVDEKEKALSPLQSNIERRKAAKNGDVPVKAFGAGQYGRTGRVSDTVNAGLYGSAASYTNIAGTAMEGLGGKYSGKKVDAEEGGRHNSDLRSKADGKNGGKKSDDLQGYTEKLNRQREIGTKAIAQKAYDKADELQEKSAAYTQSAKDGLGTFGQLLVDAGINGTQMLGDAALNLAAPGGGLWALGARSFGSGAQEARQAGATYGQQVLYGGLNAATEVLTEKMFDGLAGIYGKSALADTKLAASVGKTVEKVLGKLPTPAKKILSSMGGEAIEELVAGAVEPAYQYIYGGEGYNEDTVSDIINAMLVGGMLGGIGGGVEVAGTNTTNKRVYAPDAETAQALVDEALALNPDNKTAQKAAERLKAGKSLSGGTVTELVEQNERIVNQDDAAEMQQKDGKSDENAAQVQNAVPISQGARESGAAVGEEQKVPAEVMAQGPAAVRTYQRLAEANARMDAAEQAENMPKKAVEGAQTRFNEDGGAMAAEVQRTPQTAREAYMQAAARYDGVPYVSEEEIAQQNAEKYGEDAQTYLNAKQTSTLSAAEFDDAWSIAYAQGAAAPAGGAREGYMQLRDAMRAEYTEDQISDAAMEFAYELGREGARENERTESGVREGGQRNDGARADGQAGGVEERAGKAKDGEAKHLKGRQFRKGELAEGVKSQAAVQMVTEGETTSMKRARAIGEKRGMEVHFFRGGDLQFGDIYANGCICDGEVWIRADDPEYTAEQIMRHEAKHDAIEKGEVDPYEEWQKLEQRFGVDRMDSYVEAYAEAVAGMDLSEAEIEEEILCDAAGGMNKFEGKLDILAAEFGEVLDAAAQETTQENTERGPPESEKNTAKTGGVKYSMKGGDVLNLDIAWDNDNDSSLKSQLIKHAAEINGMEPVTEVTYDKKRGKPYFEQLDEVLRSRFNYRISRPDGMSFLFDKNAIATLRHYIGSDEEAAAAIASPYVLKRGKMISGHKNHKGNRYPSVTFAAPAKLNGNTGNIAVSVLFGDKGRVHSMRVLTPDGKQFILQKTKADSEMGYVPDKAELAAPTESASKDSIPASSEKSNKKIKTSAVGRKAEQLAVILENNPVEDDYHTWIRSESDILTLQEAIADSEWDYDEYNPDWTRKMAKEAIESGTVTVYSSKPITKGGFVSPSKMEAESYSGTGKVYSKRVAVDDVAWIDPTQGQYAPVKKVKASYAGRRATFADMSALEQAKTMESENASSEKIRQQTGWFKGYDGKWRFEIDDSRMRIDGMTLRDTGKYVALGKLVDHSELFDNYPKLSDVTIEFRSFDNLEGDAYYAPERNTIVVRSELKEDKKALREVLAHEIQHTIQNIEGFTPGADTSDFAVYLRSAGEIEAYDVGDRLDFTKKERRTTRPDIDRTDVVFSDGNTPSYNIKVTASAVGRSIEPLEKRLSGDALLDAQDLIETVRDVGGEVDDNGYITVYHRTSADAAADIRKSGVMTAKEDGLFFSTKENGYNDGYGDTVLKLTIPAERLVLDDIFGDEAHLRLPLARTRKANIGEWLEKDGADIRFSATGTAAVAALEEQNNALKEQVKQLNREKAKLQKQVESKTAQVNKWKNKATFSPERVGRDIIKAYQSTVAESEIHDSIESLIAYASKEGSSVTYGRIKEMAAGIADKIVRNAATLANSETKQEYDAIKEYHKQVKLEVSPDLKRDFADWGDWWKENGRKIHVVNGAQSNVDVIYAEMNEMFGEGYYPEDIINPADQLRRMTEVLDNLAPVLENPHSYNIAYATEACANDLADMVMQEVARGYAGTITYQLNEKLYRVRQEARELAQRAIKAESERGEDARAQIYSERVQRWETEEKRAARKKIASTVRTLDRALRNPSDNNHIPDELRGTVQELCSIFTNNRAEILQQGEQISVDDHAIFDAEKLAKARAYYDDLKGAEGFESVYDEETADRLKFLEKTIAGKRLSGLTLEELRDVKAVVEHIRFVTRTADEMFINGRKSKIQSVAQGIMIGADMKGTHEEITLKDGKGLSLKRMIAEGNLKPEYFFRRLGDSALSNMWHDILNGQNTYAFGLSEAKEFREKVDAELETGKWMDSKKTLKMKDAAGRSMEVTMGQAMYMVAAYKRERLNGNTNHVLGGGFVFEEEVVKDFKILGLKAFEKRRSVTRPHTMNEQTMEEVEKWLTEQDSRTMQYVDRMVAYLSNEMAEKGNETSMRLHGYKKFLEKFYIPMQSASEFLEKRFDSSKTNSGTNYKNKGMTKRTTQGANNPIVLREFDEVWAKHVNEMLLYNAMAVQQDNLQRIMNYKTPVDKVGTMPSSSVRAALTEAYGGEAVQYVDTLMKDINGGLMTDSREAGVNSMISLFKKNAVFASMSVAIQQPSSIARAMAVMDGKYLVQTVSQKRDYEELKKYSGVAIIKEIGGFDTTTGRSGSDWLMDSRADKTAMEKLDEVGSYLPGKMDEVTWCHIWNAVKAEIADTTDLEVGSEKYFRRCGERFNEVIELTQVYDSVLTRSENMRSQSGVLKIATSFMAEPTVTLNMVAEAVHNVREKKKDAWGKLFRTMGAVLISILLNNLLKAIVTAPRDKDKDKNILEKYAGKFASGVVQDIEPWNYVPLVKDLSEIWKGYSVEVPYWQTFENAYKGVKGLWDDTDHMRAILNGDMSGVSVDGVADAVNGIAGLFGIPAKNVWRDTRGIVTLFKETAPIKDASFDGVVDAAWEEIKGSKSTTERVEDYYYAYNGKSALKQRNATKDMEKLWQKYYKGYINKGYSEKDAKKEANGIVKRIVTQALRPKYQAAKTQAERNEIITIARHLYLGGRQLYADYDFKKNWAAED